MKKKVVLSLSGGMDSSALLIHYLRQGYSVQAISFDYGQKHYVELDRARALVKHLTEDYSPRVLPVFHTVIELNGLTDLLDSALVTGGKEVPEGHYEAKNMVATVVPNRNKIFSSIIQSIALSTANRTGDPVEIALGIHAGDHAIYPDCRKEFRDADFAAFEIGNWNSERVTPSTPFIDMNKYDILKQALDDCDVLGVSFNEVFARTNTSYKPVRYNGRWYSDYKSASSVERIEAFMKLGIPDPVAYADFIGPVSWETAKAHVEEVLAQHTT